MITCTTSVQVRHRLTIIAPQSCATLMSVVHEGYTPSKPCHDGGIFHKRLTLSFKAALLATTSGPTMMSATS